MFYDDGQATTLKSLIDMGDESAATAMVSEGNWITVFGFVPSQMNVILEYFRGLGTVESYEFGQGNWLHIKYQTRWSAQKALAKNGSILAVASSSMIGVIPSQRAMDQVSKAAESFMSPLKKERTLIGPSEATQSGGTQQSDIFMKSGLLSPRPNSELPFGGSKSGKQQKISPSTGLREAEGTAVIGEPSAVSRALGYILGW
jgi:hypothetical protein